MELAIAAGSLKVAFNLVIFGIKLDQVPATVRRCFELVRTCHRDLEDLIKLRNESLPMLESKPAILERLNTIIENAHKGLLEVARLVEKLRPEVHDGSSRFLSRLEWIFIDSSEFTSQESLISRQHSSVIAELNFLRQLVLLTPLVDGVKTSKDAVVKVEKRPVVAWDNVALLDEMLGGNKKTYSTSNQSTPNQSTSNRSTSGRREPLNVNMSQVRPVSSTGSMLTDPPPPYASPNPSFALPSTLQSPTMEIRHPSIYNAAISNAPGPSATFEGQAVVRSKTKTTFNSDGVAFLFSDVKMPTKKEVIPVQRGQSVQDTMPEVQQPSTYYKVDPMASPLPAGNPLSIDSMSRANNNPQPATMQSTIQGVPLPGGTGGLNTLPHSTGGIKANQTRCAHHVGTISYLVRDSTMHLQESKYFGRLGPPTPSADHKIAMASSCRTGQYQMPTLMPIGFSRISTSCRL
ncbi:hypothetical protein GE09DRAFT_1249685 [Coniochaeta sp. 2T2.1]|nr:hypothetical protein GE09DRAFT_1249685 [Coniochaeta sp. 2T2.1]